MGNLQTNQNYCFSNNRLSGNTSSDLNQLKLLGIDLFLDAKGCGIKYRLSPKDDFITTKDYKNLEIILSKITSICIGKEVDLSDFYNKKKGLKEEEFEEKLKIRPQDLKLVSGEVCNPHSNEEFIKSENGIYLRNSFKPSYFMQLDSNKFDFSNFDIERTMTFHFLLHLVNNDRYRVYWIINWLAYFFQGLKKSQIALVLIGIQGTGKNIFFNQIIRLLFGEAFTKTINDKSLNTKYKATMIENVLFLNLDEISANTSLSNSQKNFIKALVTNSTITAEKKFENLEQETPLYAQVLITSNEAYALEIEPNDRRFTVLSTGDTLVSTNFLGLGSYEALSDVLKSELEMVACYLKAYPVDVQMANTALSTPEKDELIHQYEMKQEARVIKQKKILQVKLTKLQKNLNEFAYCIRNKDIVSFEPIKFEDQELFQIIIDDFFHNIFRVENLLPVYRILYGNSAIRTNSELLRELQNIDFNLFSTRNITTWTINNIQKECLNLPYYSRNYY